MWGVAPRIHPLPLSASEWFPVSPPTPRCESKRDACFGFLPPSQKCYHFLFQRYRLEHYTVSSNWLALGTVSVFGLLSLSRSVALFRGGCGRSRCSLAVWSWTGQPTSQYVSGGSPLHSSGPSIAATGVCSGTHGGHRCSWILGSVEGTSRVPQAPQKQAGPRLESNPWC